MSRSQPTSLLNRKDPGWFSVPNDLVDKYAYSLKARGVFVYVILARAVTAKHYPTVLELSSMCRLSETKVESILREMYLVGLLNKYDVIAIRGSPFDE